MKHINSARARMCLQGAVVLAAATLAVAVSGCSSSNGGLPGSSPSAPSQANFTPQLSVTPGSFTSASNDNLATISWNTPPGDASNWSCTGTESLSTDNSATDATSIAAGAGSFAGTQPAAAPTDGVSVGPLAQVGTYYFGLTCTPSDGSAALDYPTAKVTVTQEAVGVATGNCDATDVATGTAKPLVNASANDTTFSATPATTGICVGCSVANQGASVVDSDLTNDDALSVLLSLLGSKTPNSTGAAESLTVTNMAMATTPNGAVLPPYATTSPVNAGFVVQVPKQLLAAGVLQSVSVSTMLNNLPVQTADVTGSVGTGLKLKVLGIVGGKATPASFLSVTATQPFDAIQLRLSGLANVNNHLNVFYACVAQPAPASSTAN